MATEEWVDVVDLEDRVVGSVPRSDMRAGGLLHRATSILVTRSDGEVYVHRRTETKDVHPGMYDPFVGGVVGSGESYDGCAARELGEEVGITIVEPRALFRYLYRGETSECWTAVYEVTWDGDVKPQLEEIAWGNFVPWRELGRMLATLPFCPDSREIVLRGWGDKLGA
ncbi:MAG: NUDIX domain-containing protein [Actinomycetota bacterium]|nr:NUDIX domain-containing protein [Actinomycetota bacterium]MDH5224310.1 NUDIX domain-containing protein [Actinomycetota bacterium]MDH5314710.1 NUDIX domain-containing protein [Actinomycetota bacterium]